LPFVEMLTRFKESRTSSIECLTIKISKSTDKTYTFLDHTADLRIRVVGKDLVDLFQNAGLAISDLIDDSNVKTTLYKANNAI
jgi:hypothetical protein